MMNDAILSTLIGWQGRGIPVIVYTTNGFMMHGTLKSVSDDGIVLASVNEKNKPCDKVVFNHAISTICPR